MKSIGPINALYPMPTTLVGSTVNNRPNFLAVAHVGILNHGTPQYLSVFLNLPFTVRNEQMRFPSTCMH